MTLSGRERQLFRLTIIAVVLFACYFFFVEPVLNRLDSIDGRERSLAQRESELNKLLARRPGIVDDIHLLEEQITSSAPETIETDFHAHLKNLASESGVVPSAVDMVKRQPLRDDFEEIILEIRLEATTQKFTDYLYRLESSQRLVKISRLDIGRNPRSKAGDNALSVNMRLSTVVKAMETAAGTSGADSGGGAEDEKK